MVSAPSALPDEPRSSTHERLRRLVASLPDGVVPMLLLLVALPVLFRLRTHAYSTKLQLRSLGWSGLLAMAAAASLMARHRLLGPRRNVYALSVLVGCVVVAVWSLWNMWFIGHYYATGYTSGVFAHAYLVGISPLYARTESPAFLAVAGVYGLGLLSLFWLVWGSWRREPAPLSAAGVAPRVALVQLLFVVAFALSDRLERLVHDFDAVLPFKEDARLFVSASELLRTYVARMPTLSFRGGHYPPGLALLYQLQTSWGWPGLVKLVELGAGVAAAALTVVAARRMSSGPGAPLYAGLLLASSVTTCVFTTTAESAVLLPLVVAAAYFTGGAVHDGRTRSAAALGFVLAAMMFFSFVATTVGVVIAMYGVAIVASRGLPWRRLAGTALAAGAAFIAVYLVLWGAFGFNIVECLYASVHSAKSAMHPDAGSTSATISWARWWIRASGNTLGYLLSLGFAPLALAALAARATLRGWRERALTEPLAGAMGLALFAGLAFAGLSGLFYLETERVWMFFTPLAALAGGPALAVLEERHGRVVALAVLWSCFIFSATQELFLKHYFGTVG